MIIYKCDLCKKETLHLDTMILYKRGFDYCNECKEKAEEIKQRYKRKIEYEYCMLDSKLKLIEKQYLAEIRKGGTNDR